MEAPAAEPARPADTSPTVAEKQSAGARLEDELKWLRAEWLTVKTVSSASKFEQNVADAPSSVTIITDDEIKRFGYRTLADVLGSVRGFHVTYDRNYHFLGMRGFGRPGDFNSRVLMLVDGHRANDVMFDGAAIGTDSPIPVDLIDRVEVVRGPGSAVYGSSAFFGVINIVTKRGRAIDGVVASASAGSFGTYDGRFTLGRQFTNGVEALISGSRYSSDGPSNLLLPGLGVARNVDRDRAWSALTTVTWRDFTLQGSFVTREKQIPSGAFGTVFNDPNNRTVDERSYLDLKFAHHFDERGADVQARLYYDHYYFDGTYVYPGTQQPYLAEGDRWGFEMQYRQSLWEQHAVTLGFDYRDDFRQHQHSRSLTPLVVFLDDSHTLQTASPYVETDWLLRDNLTLHAGARFDHYSTFGGVANPRVALVYHPWERTNLKLLYGSAFRAPNTPELYAKDATAKANPSLQPEDIQTYELVWEQELHERFSVATSVYHYDLKNLISQVRDPADGLFVYQNREQVRADGLELELKGSTPGGFRGRLSYAFANVADATTRARLSNSPRHVGKLHLVAPVIPERVALGAELLFTSATRTPLGASAASHWLLNLNLVSQRILPNTELSAGLYNVFDRRYNHVVGDEFATGLPNQGLMPQDGRSFRLKLTSHF